MIDALMEYILPALKRNKDDEYVGSGLRRVLSQGTGASLQRQFYLEGGFESVLSGSAAFIAD
jgi:carboxylate-amine ligase